MKKQLPGLKFKDSRLCIKLVASSIVLVFLLGSFSGVSGRGVLEKNLGESIETPLTLNQGTAFHSPVDLKSSPNDQINVTPMHVLSYLFRHGSTPPGGGDYNKDGKINIADVVFLTKNQLIIKSVTSTTASN